MTTMTDRERLIELLVQSTQKCDSTDCNNCKYWNTNDCGAARMADTILSDGWIRPPCKVGDTVYRIKYNHQLQKDIIISYKVTEILYSSNRGVRPFIFVTDLGYRFDNCDIYPNKEIYLSKKEAKKALAEKGV